jgi:type 1 glutamine amidotransferase
LALVASVLYASAALQAADAPAKPAKILMLSQSAGFRHGSVTRKDGQLSPAERAMTELGISSNLFRVDATQDASTITKEQLDNYDIVMFYTTGNLPFTDEVRDYLFNEWVKKKGHGFIGTHSAADTYHDYQPYWEMLGGTFNGHPWNAGEHVTVSVHDPKHPVSKPWGEEFEIQDEIYQFKHWQPEKVHVLMSLNMAKTKLKKPYQVPIAWVKTYGDGKVLHMSLGHREDVWTNQKYLQSLLGGVKWMLGLEPGDAAPNPDVSSAQEAKAKTDFEAAQNK